MKRVNVIAEFRRRRGVTQRELARRTGLTVNYISLIETSGRTPSLETLLAIAEALDAELVIDLQPKETDHAD